MNGELEFARVAVAVLGTAVATYYDLTRNRNVPDWLTFGMVGLGAIAVVASKGIGASLVVAAPAIVVLAAGYLLYREGQIGGADVLLFAAIALLMPEAPGGIVVSRRYIISLPFVFSLFLASGILFGVVTFARFVLPSLGALHEGEVKVGARQKVYLAFMGLVALVFVWFALANRLPAASLVVVVMAMAFSAFFYLFRSFVARRFLIREVGAGEMDEEDVLAIEEMDPAVVKKYGLKKLLTKKEIGRLEKLRLKRFPVYKNMPAFTPYILLALLLSILFGDLVLLLFSLS